MWGFFGTGGGVNCQRFFAFVIVVDCLFVCLLIGWSVGWLFGGCLFVCLGWVFSFSFFLKTRSVVVVFIPKSTGKYLKSNQPGALTLIPRSCIL